MPLDKIELDQRRYYKYRNPIILCEYVESIVQNNKDRRFYLFIDEVQLTAKIVDEVNGGIEVTVYDMLNELKAYENLDVYVTGSNSKGLSKGIATEFNDFFFPNSLFAQMIIKQLKKQHWFSASAYTGYYLNLAIQEDEMIEKIAGILNQE